MGRHRLALPLPRHLLLHLGHDHQVCRSLPDSHPDLTPRDCRLYASEIQPIRTRATVTAVATACNQFFNTLVALTIPIFLEKTRSGRASLHGCLRMTETLT